LNRVLIIGIICLSIYSLYVFAERAKGEYSMYKAFKEQARGRFQRMYAEVNRAENTYFELDLTATPLDWYRGFALNYLGSDSALYYFKKAELKNPFHIQLLSDIGATLENHQQHEDAIQYLQRALKIIPVFPEAHYNLAIAYYNTNKFPSALNEIDQVVLLTEDYQRSVDAIIRKNAELLYDSLKQDNQKERLNYYMKNLLALREIHANSKKSQIPFLSILEDSCTISKSVKN